MLRVTDVWERALHGPATAVDISGDISGDASGEVIIIRAGGSYDGKQGMSLATGVSSRSAGSRALCLHLVTIPPGTPHLPVNRSDVMTVAVVARTDPQEQESVVAISLPPHLSDLDAFPVASQ